MTQSTLQLHASTAGGHDTNVTVVMNETSDARVMLVIVGRGSRAARVVWRLRGTTSCFLATAESASLLKVPTG